MYSLRNNLSEATDATHAEINETEIGVTQIGSVPSIRSQVKIIN